MNVEQLKQLINQVLSGSLSVEEQVRLKNYVQNPDNRAAFIDIFDELTQKNTDQVPFREDVWNPIIQEVVKIDRPSEKEIQHAGDLPPVVMLQSSSKQRLIN